MKFPSFQDVLWVSDWNVIIEEERYISTDFEKEIDMVRYIVDNIDDFAKDILNDEVIMFDGDPKCFMTTAWLLKRISWPKKRNASNSQYVWW